MDELSWKRTDETQLHVSCQYAVLSHLITLHEISFIYSIYNKDDSKNTALKERMTLSSSLDNVWGML